MLDALLMWAVAIRDELPPIMRDDVQQLSIPIQRSACGRIWLCSEAQLGLEEHEQHWINRRFPIAEAEHMGVRSFKRIQLSTGATKSYRLPLEVGFVRGGVVEWFGLGDAEEIRPLLSLVTHLGKKRGVGKGEIARWEVENIDPWPGFPVVRNGTPLRALPLDWEGVDHADHALRVLTPPYYQRWREEDTLVGC
jgi:hypothetical protein